MTKYYFIIFLLIVPIPLIANEIAIERILSQAEKINLSKHPYWHKLMHYRPSFTGNSFKSDIISAEYFLSLDGNSNPKSELKSTLISFFERPTNNTNKHTQCRFVSRYKWLKQILNWEKIAIEDIKCPQYLKWTRSESVQSIGLIFATGYLGNPASLFGHPLLKFNFKDKNDPKNLMDTSVNYGAFTPKQVNPFAYTAKGIFGGYDAGFTHMNFFYNNHNYTENELRDLWEYELNLSNDQVDKIVDHVWDLLGMKIPYLFFSDNCAYRMAELLEMALDFPLLPKNVPYAIPYSIFDRLAEAKIIKNYSLIPSRQSRLSNRYLSLSKKNQKLSKSIIKNTNIVHSKEFQENPLEQKFKILEIVLDYFSYKSSVDKKNLEIKKQKREILIERLKLPPGKNKWKVITSQPPHKWQRPFLLQFSLIYNNKSKLGTSIRWRPAYYDLLTPNMGQLKNNSLSIADFEFSYIDNKLRFDHFEFFKIKSLNLPSTDLPEEGGLAWKISSGFEKQNLSCLTCFNLYLESGIGKAYAISRNLIVYMMLNPRIQTQVQKSGNYSLSPKIASIINFSKYWKTHLSVAKRYYLNGNKSKHPIYLWENRFFSSRNWDIRLSFNKHIAKQIKLSLSHYW